MEEAHQSSSVLYFTPGGNGELRHLCILPVSSSSEPPTSAMNPLWELWGKYAYACLGAPPQHYQVMSWGVSVKTGKNLKEHCAILCRYKYTNIFLRNAPAFHRALQRYMYILKISVHEWSIAWLVVLSEVESIARKSLQLMENMRWKDLFYFTCVSIPFRIFSSFNFLST